MKSRAKRKIELETAEVKAKNQKFTVQQANDDDRPPAELLDRINTFAHAGVLAAGAFQEQEMFTRAALYSMGIFAQELIREEVDLIFQDKEIDTKSAPRTSQTSTVIEDVD